MTWWRRKTFVDRVAEALGRRPRRSGSPALRGGLVALGAAAGVTAASAAVSAIRSRQDRSGEEGQDDRP